VPAGIFNLTDQCAIEQGSDFSFSFIYNDVNGAPVNLTGYTITGSIAKDWALPILGTFSCSAPTPTNGTVNVSLSGAASSALIPDRYRYDILATNGSVYTHLLKGFVDVVESITLPK